VVEEVGGRAAGSRGCGLGEVGLGDLRIGDAVRVHWLDASEATRPLTEAHRAFDTPIRSYGVFLGVKGLRTRHLVIAKEIIEVDRTFHYNVIPVGMIERVFLLRRGDLDPDLLRHLHETVARAPVKRFGRRLSGPALVTGRQGGWMRYA